jgi:hypothetical protein
MSSEGDAGVSVAPATIHRVPPRSQLDARSVGGGYYFWYTGPLDGSLSMRTFAGASRLGSGWMNSGLEARPSKVRCCITSIFWPSSEYFSGSRIRASSPAGFGSFAPARGESRTSQILAAGSSF